MALEGPGCWRTDLLLNALRKFPNCQILAFSSNTDAGGKEIVAAVEKEENFIHIVNMLSSDFLSLMACADVMVGNSSAAVREAPSFHLPAINIGTRQQGRLRAANVIDTSHNELEIVAAIKRGLFDKEFLATVKQSVNPYGDGKSAKRIVDILEKTQLNRELIQKIINYDI